MSTELKNAVKAADVYKGMVPEDVVPYIEGELYISMVPVEPGLTNTAREENGQRVIGLNTENQEIHEGLIKFDIIFYAWEPIKTDPAASFAGCTVVTETYGRRKINNHGNGVSYTGRRKFEEGCECYVQFGRRN